MIENWAYFIRFIIVLGAFGAYLFFLTPKQFREVLAPSDWLTGFRWAILAVLLGTTITLIPSLVYLFYAMQGQDYPALRNIASVVGGTNLIFTTIAMVFLYTYRTKS